jgi:hypothetical protein
MRVNLVNMPLALVILVIVGALYYFASRGDASGQDNCNNAEEELLHLCLGNQKQAERLVALEVSKAPGIKRCEAVSRALASLRRDVR